MGYQNDAKPQWHVAIGPSAIASLPQYVGRQIAQLKPEEKTLAEKAIVNSIRLGGYAAHAEHDSILAYAWDPKVDPEGYLVAMGVRIERVGEQKRSVRL